MLVRQEASSLGGAHPPDLVDLLVRREVLLGTDRARAPVADPLGAFGDEVGRVRQRMPETDSEAGLLGDLAHRGGCEVLAGLGLALRKGPVVIARTMDDEQLHSPGIARLGRRAGAVTPDDSAGGRRQLFTCHASYCPCPRCTAGEAEVTSLRFSRAGLGVYVASVLVMALAVSFGWWAAALRPDTRPALTSALDVVPFRSNVVGFTHWSQIRENVGLDDAARRDLTTRSVIDGVENMRDLFGWSLADLEWEVYGQDPAGAASVVRLDGSVSFDDVREKLQSAGYRQDGRMWIDHRVQHAAERPRAHRPGASATSRRHERPESRRFPGCSTSSPGGPARWPRARRRPSPPRRWPAATA